jgi:hypothetical protein
MLLLAVALPVARWMEGRWTPLGIGLAVSAATAGAACVLLGRVLVVLRLSLASYLREVIVPGFAPYLVAALLAWPVLRLAHAVNRWQGAAVFLVAGILYLAGVAAMLDRWVLTAEEKEKARVWLRQRLRWLRKEEAIA